MLANYIKTLNQTHPALTSITSIILIFIAAYLINKIIKYFILRLHKQFKRTETSLDTALIVALKKPIIMFVWIIAAIFSFQTISLKLDSSIVSFFVSIKIFALVFCIIWFAIRAINQYTSRVVNKRKTKNIKVDRTSIDAISKLSKAIVTIIGVLVVMQQLGIKIGGVLAFGGISGIAIGFAAKDLLSNIFGAVMIYLDKPFVVGDWICSPDRKIEGIVEEISWRLTKVTTFEKHPLYIPNSMFSNIIIENRTRIKCRRVYEIVRISLKDFDKVDAITMEIKKMLKEHPEISKKQSTRVVLDHFGESSLNILVYTYINTIEYTKYCVIKQELLLNIGKIIKKHKAEITYPSTNVYVNHREEDKKK